MGDYIEVNEEEAQEASAVVIDIENEANITAVSAYLKDVITSHINNFIDRDTKLTDIIRQREVKPSSGATDKDGRTDSVPPITASVINTAFGHVKNYFDNRYPFYDAVALGKETSADEEAEVSQNYINMLVDSRSDLNMRAKNTEILYDATGLGTKIVRTIWDDDSFLQKGSYRGQNFEINFEKHFGPSLVPVDTRDVIYPAGFSSVQDMPWIAIRMRVSKFEYRRMFLAGQIKFYGEEEGVYIEPADAELTTDMVDEQDRRGTKIDSTDMVELWEVYFYWELMTDDGERTMMLGDYIGLFDFKAGKLLNIQPNTLGKRPLDVIPYIVLPGNIEGLGVGHLTYSSQVDAEFWNNTRQKNAKFAVNKTFLSPVGGLLRNQTLEPGKIIYYNNVGDVPQELRISEVPGSSVELEDRSFSYGRQASGISSVMGGMADQTLKSRDTYAGQSFRFKQSMGVLGAIIENMENGYAGIADTIWRWLILKKDEVIKREREIKRMSESDIAILERALTQDIGKAPVTIRFSIKTTDINQTQDSLRQNYLLVSQLIEQHFQSVAPAYQIITNPHMQIPPELKMFYMQMIVSKTEMLKKVLDDLSVNVKNRMVPNTSHYALMLDQANAQINAMVDQAKNIQAQGGVNGQQAVGGQETQSLASGGQPVAGGFGQPSPVGGDAGMGGIQPPVGR